ncbi:MAG TPA: hypothetical protein VI758_05295 [Bacteroidota bacterium]
MPKPNFTGTWKFNPARSLLQIPAPNSSSFVIEHADPAFRLTRTHFIGETSDTFSVDLTTDGRGVRVHRPGLIVHARAYWEGNALVFDSTVMRGEETGSNVVRYTLADDLNSIVAEEHFRSKGVNYDNVWILDRSTQE